VFAVFFFDDLSVPIRTAKSIAARLLPFYPF
jgi:hypothetical protein